MASKVSSSQLQRALESVVQSIQWTYSLFWQLCPQQGALVWRDGHYNGAIKTRKMVQAMEERSEEVLQNRGEQLKELYDCLLAGEAEKKEEQRSSSAALLPEDLTDVEWFYLMCISFAFPPGVGLPGKAFANKRHAWLVRANQADSKTFSRAILAKSAQVQTVVCIPVMDGVLELGTVEKVEEDPGLVQYAKSFFTDLQDIHTKPTLSEHSISSPVAYTERPIYKSQTMMQQKNIGPHGSSKEDYSNDDEEDNDPDDEDEGDEEEAYNVNASWKSNFGVEAPLPTNSVEIDQQNIPIEEQSEMMRQNLSEEIRLASLNEYSNDLATALELFAACQDINGQNDNQGLNDNCHSWNVIHEGQCSTFQRASATQSQGFSPMEDVNYSQSISCIMQYNLNNWTDSSYFSGHSHDSPKSAFSKWNPRMDYQLSKASHGNSQWLLRKMLFGTTNIYCKYKNENPVELRDGGDPQKGKVHEELSANHVLAERRRREKINESFITLRSLVPFVTKMDKTSILGDTIEYIEKLKKRISDIEEKKNQTENDSRLKAQEIDNTSNAKDQTFQFNSKAETNWKTGNQKGIALSEKKKMRLTADGGTKMLQSNLEASNTNVQVSITESHALLEIQCQHTEGLLLRIMQTLDDVRLEITSIQCSTINNTFIAELRAKVKEANEKRVSIVEVKKAMKQIFLSS